MSSQRQLPTETANSLKHIFDVLVNALQSTTAGSAKLLLYLIATITILNIIGHDKINSLVIPPAILYVIKGLAASPVIQKIVDQLGGDLLANMIEHFANRDSLREDKILEFIENQINTKELNQLIDNVVQDSALLKEQDFYRVVARQQREDKKQTAMLELLVQHAIAGSITENTPYQLPSRMLTENFVNREDELKQITSHLQPGKTIIVTGSGGIGKSALAAEALWQIHEDFELRKRFPDGVVIYDWSLQPNVSIASSIIAHAFGYPSVNDPNVIKSIMNSKKCLLIFDNAEEATELEFLLSGSHSCGIIITSRRNLPIDGIHIELQRLSDAQGEELLRKLLNIEAVTTPIFIQELIQELEGLPLALALASKHIDRKSNDATSYLQWLRNSLKALEIADGRKHSLPLVIQQNIRSVSKVARLVLLVMGNHAFRPLTDVTFAIAFHPNFQFSQGEIQNALSELIDQNLVQVHKVDFDDGKYIAMYEPKHRLIHRCVREYSSQEWNEEWNEILDRMVSNVVLGPLELFINEQEVDEELYSDTLYLDALILQENLLKEKRWTEAIHCSEVLYRHAQHRGDSIQKSQILRAGLRAAAELNDEFGQTNILHELGYISLTQGDLDNSEKCLNRALELSKLDENVENEAKVLNTLALVFHNKNNQDKAFIYRRRALSLSNSIENNETRFKILFDSGLAMVRFKYGHPKQAISLLETAIEIAKSESYITFLAEIYFNLGNAQHANGEHMNAIASLEQSSYFAIQNDQQDLNLSAKTSLGNIYHFLNQIENARSCYQDALTIAREQKDIETYAVNLGNLGLVYKQLGNKSDAIKYFKEALEIFERTNEEYAQLTRERIDN